MKTINVVAAIIQDRDKVLAAQRGYGKFKGRWEFPGGKIEPDETQEAALTREIKEELDATLQISCHFITVHYDYPEFHLTMDCYLCSIPGNQITLLEHSAFKWLDKDHLESVDWLSANTPIIEKLKLIL